MAKIVKEETKETIYTVELSQKELNTIVKLIGIHSRNSYQNKVVNCLNTYSHEVLSTVEVFEMYDRLAKKTTHRIPITW